MSHDTTDRRTNTMPFAAPSAGSWELDHAHFSPDCSRIARDAIEAAMHEGIRDGFDLVGAPVETIDARFINGRFYRRLVPLVGAGRNLPDPPAFALKLATRVHPTFRPRTKMAAAALEGRMWMDELERWESTWKPDLIATSRRLGSVDLDGLDDVGMAALITEANAHVVAGLILHFRLHISDLGPIGLLLVRGRDWGFDAPTLMQCLSGYSAATSAPAHVLADIAACVSGEVATLDDVRAAGAEATAALDAFIDEFGHRLTGGYDLTDKTLIEMPDTIVAGIASAQARDVDDRAPDRRARELGDRVAAELRARVPAAERETFDRVVDDARALYGLRDENGPITYQWPAGILRRIVLEAGRRLATSGRLEDASHVFDLSADELASSLRGERSMVSSDEAARRHRVRHEWLDLDPPPLLGPEPVIPPLEALPGPLADLMDMILTVLDLIESPPEHKDLTGVGVGEGAYTGRARVVSDAIDALEHFEPGDVLITPFTVPTINAVLAMAGAVVTEEGGLLSHAAVIAREFGIPGVIGVTDASVSIADGSMVEVDAKSGAVTVL